MNSEIPALDNWSKLLMELRSCYESDDFDHEFIRRCNTLLKSFGIASFLCTDRTTNAFYCDTAIDSRGDILKFMTEQKTSLDSKNNKHTTLKTGKDTFAIKSPQGTINNYRAIHIDIGNKTNIKS